MHERKWHVVDIYYSKSEQKSADKEGAKLVKQGYIREFRDAGIGEDFCDQYIKIFPKKVFESERKPVK